MNLSKSQLQEKINSLLSNGEKVALSEILAGGVVSDVYAAKYQTDGKVIDIALKYTKEDMDLGYIFSVDDKQNVLDKAQETHSLDIQIQDYLSVNTPKILKHFPKDHITLMVNFVNEGFTLLQSLLIQQHDISNSAIGLGRAFASIRFDLEKEKNEFKQVEDSKKQFSERFYELKTLLYNGRMDIFNKIEAEFLDEACSKIIWTDGDQKNVALNNKGMPLFFDFGRSIICDPDFIIPNFLGHIGLFIISNHFNRKIGINFLNTCLKSFNSSFRDLDNTYSFNEEKFVNYFTASVLHRGMAMRWIDPRIANIISESSLKQAVLHFGDIIFDKEKRVDNIKDLVKALEFISKSALNEYKRPKY